MKKTFTHLFGLAAKNNMGQGANLQQDHSSHQPSFATEAGNLQECSRDQRYIQQGIIEDTKINTLSRITQLMMVTTSQYCFSFQKPAQR